MTYPDGTPVQIGDTVSAAVPIKWSSDKVYPAITRVCTVRAVNAKSLLVEYPLTFMGSAITGMTYLVAGEFTKVPRPLGSASVAQQTITIPITIIVAAPGLTFVANPNKPPQLTAGVAMSPYSLGTPSGGTPPYQWKIDPNTPAPAGISVNASGELVGTPTAAGTFSFNVILGDSGV